MARPPLDRYYSNVYVHRDTLVVGTMARFDQSASHCHSSHFLHCVGIAFYSSVRSYLYINSSSRRAKIETCSLLFCNDARLWLFRTQGDPSSDARFSASCGPAKGQLTAELMIGLIQRSTHRNNRRTKSRLHRQSPCRPET